jgi:hypothetical protein
MHIYEYLFTAVVILTILMASTSMISVISEPTRSVSEKEQLKVVAQKLMAQILLDPGDPVDWGNSATTESDLKTIGLAKYSATTREAYVLDPDKVLRLDDALLLVNNTHSLYISPSTFLNSLNLGYDYGLALEFSHALTANISRISSLDEYEIITSSEYSELPIVGANVTARTYYYDANIDEIVSTDSLTNQTNYDGKCVVDFGDLTSQMKILIVVIDYYGVSVVRIFQAGSNLTRAHLLGNRLFVNTTYDANEAYEIIVTKKAGAYAIENVTSGLTKVEDGIFDLTYVEPSTVAVLAVPEDGDDMIFASLEANIIYSSISDIRSFPSAYSIVRTVAVGGSFYIVRLHLWRMSW